MKTVTFDRPYLFALIGVALLVVPLPAGPLSTAKPEEVGISSERLKRIGEMVQRHMSAHQVAGAVTLVARRGRIAHFEAHGFMDLESKTPMTKDAIFHIASMTKPVTGVAVMMLVEEGKIRLNDPVSRFIPEFKNIKVAVANVNPNATMPGNRAGDIKLPVTLVPPIREVTIRDLLTHTSGLQGRGPGVSAVKIAPRSPTDKLADYIPRLGAAALDFQPGMGWAYSPLAGPDTLGRVVEIVSGLPFDRFLAERLFGPLGMKDTAFSVSADRMPRLATVYYAGENAMRRRSPNQIAGEFCSTPCVYFSGAGGLSSTAEDYLQFAQMLLNGGQLNGRRFLSPKTVELMSTDHVGELYATGCAHDPYGPCDFYDQRGMGFGLLVDVVKDAVAAGIGVSNGSFGWAGGNGTRFWVDPKEQMVTILMVATRSVLFQRDFEYAVKQALIE